MKAQLLLKPREPLQFIDMPKPEPSPGEVLVRVHTCGVCRTDLHIVDGELSGPTLPLVPGHQIVGTIESLGANVKGFAPGQRIGIPWLGKTCGRCKFCTSGRENLCDNARFTGYTRNGGFAEYTVADAQFCFKLPEDYPDDQAAPLLCAGLIGYRALRMAGSAKSIGFYGFGAAAHILTQVSCYQNRRVYAFTRPGDHRGQSFAKTLGACWSGDSTQRPPERLDAAIIFAPVGALVVEALRSVDKGGRVICAGIHMSDVPSFPYNQLWEERSICSVANLTRKDGDEFLGIAPKIPVHSTVHLFPLEQANDALDTLRQGLVDGAIVLRISEP
ncbi:MAG: zinc-dependent alcohol dehydrogenase family protein [Fibrobacterota bacterium]